MKKHSPYLRYVIVGRIRRDWIVTSGGALTKDQPGGSLLYSYAGMRTWDRQIGLVAKVNRGFPLSDLSWLGEQGNDLRGITVAREFFDMRQFLNYEDPGRKQKTDPISFFSHKDLPFPRGLLGYSRSTQILDSKTAPLPYSIRESDIPIDYLEATSVHIAPIDYITHLALPSFFRNYGATAITLDPSSSYMHPSFLRDLPALFKGVTALITSERKLRSLFSGKSIDLWEIAEFLLDLGVEIVVIKRGNKGQWLYDGQQKKRWEIPAYPVKSYDPTGCGDSFCGGFLAGYRNTYSSLEAVLCGNVSASLCLESRSPASQLDFLPGISEMRMEVLREKVRAI
jgi:hypothetical protein